MGRIMAIDPGEKRLGVAISDPTGTIATPCKVIPHVSRIVDAAAIAQLAVELAVEVIVVGQALDSEGNPGPAARHSARLAEAIASQTQIAVVLWDESDSTDIAVHARLEMGTTRENRRGHLDEIAATVILQSYLEAQRNHLR